MAIIEITSLVTSLRRRRKILRNIELGTRNKPKPSDSDNDEFHIAENKVHKEGRKSNSAPI